MAILAISGGEIFGYIVLALAIAAVVALAMNYRKVGPNQVLIVSGGVRRTIRDADGTEREVGYTMRIGVGALVLPFLHTADVLSL